MITLTREKYWNSVIAINCPRTDKKHTINYCFKHCDSFGYIYRKDSDGSIGAHLYCNMKSGNPDLFTGKLTRCE